MRRWIKRLSFTLIIGFLIAWAGLHFLGASILLTPYRVPTDHDLIPKSFGSSALQLELIAEDSILLSGYHIQALQYPKGTFIICHGISSSKESQINLSLWLKDLGYNSMLFDGRAHGESGGNYCTFGFHEKKDISKIVDHLISTGEENIFIMGTSLGGAVALQALEDDERIAGGIILSTFSDLRGVTLDYQKRLTGISWEWLNKYVLSRAEETASIAVDDISPKKSCLAIEQPIFIAHGTEDIHIPPSSCEINFNALKSQTKELYWIEGGTHNNIWQQGGDAFENAMKAFIQMNF